jgi:bifunctional DNase/RNase
MGFQARASLFCHAMTTPGTKCESEGCSQHGNIHVTAVDRRQLAWRRDWCEIHARELLQKQWSEPPATRNLGPARIPVTCPSTGWTEFDPELLAYEDDKLQAHLLLSEVSGSRRFWIAIGYAESAALYWKIERKSFVRPLTHDALATTISGLDGKLREVLIDEFLPAQHVFHAKLRIAQSRDVVAVDVRPSDGIIMAMACNVPIFVAHNVVSLCDSTHPPN